MSKIYILDTNVLLHDPKSLFSFADNEVVIPLVVLDELDKKKDGHTEVARHARMVIRSLDDMRLKGKLDKGVETPAGGIVRVELNHKDNIPIQLDPARADNRIISVVLGLKKDESPKRKVALVTKDINLRVKCDALGVKAEDYSTDSVADNAEAIYSGVTELSVPDKHIDMFHDMGYLDPGIVNKYYSNQYVLLRSNIAAKKTGMARFDGERLVKIEPQSEVWGIKPRNKEQVFAFDALFNPNISLVTMIGKAGCGKTLLAAAAGLGQVFDNHNFRKLIITRPVVPMGKDIGYLPGDKDEKMKHWMAPLWDNLELLCSEKGQGYMEMERQAGGKIEVEALTYIRGRSIPKTIIIVDECQNLTRHEVKTIITRVGENSKVILTGDIQQIDNAYIDAVDNGLSYVIEKFKDEPESAHITLQKGERSALATKAAELL